MTSKIIGISLCVFVLEAQFIHAEDRIEQERVQIERLGPERVQQEQFNRERKGYQERTQEMSEPKPLPLRYSCPDLTDWTGELSYQGWSAHVHHDYIPPHPTWYAYDAWILPNPKELAPWTAQCNYVAYFNNEKVGKVTFGRVLPQGAESYLFAGPSYGKLSKTGKECSPWKEGARIKNAFPSDCQFVRTTAGVE